MTNEEFKKGEEYNYKILDSIDLYPYIIEGNDIIDTIHEIENAVEVNRIYGNEIIDNNIMQGYIFNYLSIDEIMEYLQKRYNTRFSEHISYTVYNKGTRKENDINK